MNEHEELISVLKELHNRIAELVALKALELTTAHTTDEISAVLFGDERING